MRPLLKTFLAMILCIFLIAKPTIASRETDSYDGNIFFLYGANGSLVPPSSTLSESLAKKRTSVIVYYLDDSATSKAFAPSVSALQLLWGPNIDLIPIATDELQNQNSKSPEDPSYYWSGVVPQVLVIDGEGKIQLNEEGQVNLETINAAISTATGKEKPSFTVSLRSFNEYNSEPQKKARVKE